MAKTVNTTDTFETWRSRYNELATDVGDVSGLRTINQTTIVDAVNSIQDLYFYYQEFEFTASSGQTAFSGTDNFSNTLSFRQNRVQVFKNGALLRSGVDYAVGGPSGGLFTTITLTTPASLNDIIRLSTFTGSYLDVQGTEGAADDWELTALGAIYNNNASGVIINGDGSSPTTTLESGYTVQLEGNTFVDGNMKIDTGHTFESPSITDGTATITSGVGTGFSSITSTAFVGDITGDVTGTVSSLSNLDTDDLAEGSTNQYFSNTLARNAISASGDISYDSSSGVISFTAASAPVTSVNGSTGAVVLDTDDLAEGTNKFYTDERVDDRVDTLLTAGTGISLSYDDSAGSLTITNSATTDTESIQDIVGAQLVTNGSHTNITATYDDAGDGAIDLSVTNLPNSALANSAITINGSSVSLGGTRTLTTNDISENTNLYYTDERVDDRVANLITAGTNISKTYDDSAGTLTLNNTYEWYAIDGDGTQVTMDGGKYLKYVEGAGIDVNLTDTTPGSSSDPYDLSISLDYEITSSAPTDATGTSTGHLWFVV
jgi:hypothetical protein